MNEDPEQSIVRRRLSTDDGNPGPRIAEVVAEIEDREMTEMATMYNCVDGVLDNLFSDPPAAEAKMRVEFSYEGYRITVDQDGLIELFRTEA